MTLARRYEIEVDIKSGKNKAVIPQFILGDSNVIDFAILENGVPSRMGGIGRIVANFKRADGQIISRLLSYSGNIVTYEVGSEEMLSTGLGNVEVQFFNEDNTRRLTTFSMRVNMVDNLGAEEILNNDPEMTLLQSLFLEVENVGDQVALQGDYAENQGDYAKAQGDAVDAKVSASVEGALSDVNAQLAQTAKQSDLEVEKQRINNFITLPEGSTTNDARLEDIRIGVDGFIYASPSEAVRKQISAIKENLSDLGVNYGIIAEPFIQGSIGSNGVEAVSQNRVRTGYINTTEYDLLYTESSDSICARFYNSSNNLIGTWSGDIANPLTAAGVEGIWAKNVPIKKIINIKPEAVYVRLMYRYDNNANITPSQAKCYGSKINLPDYAKRNELDSYAKKTEIPNASVIIDYATIYNMPNTVVKPTIEFNEQIMNDNIGRAKPTIFKNGDYYVLPYNENLDGNINDLPTQSTTGTLAMKYKWLQMSGNTIVSQNNGTIAQKGSQYTDYNGQLQTFVGGCGLPSAVNGKQYFSSVIEGGTVKNNGSYQRFVPCVVDISVTGEVVQISEIRELTLSISGTIGAFDLSRLGYTDLYAYYTTTPPHYDGTKYHWCQPVKDGFVYLTSTDGIVWLYVSTVKTAYEPRYEVSCCIITGTSGSHLMFAARTGWDKQKLYVGRFNGAGGYISFQYAMDDIGSRPQLVRTGGDCLLFHTISEKRNVAECIRIMDDTYGFTFLRWFTLYNKATWYPHVMQENLLDGTFTEMYLAGVNGRLGNKLEFIILNFESGKPKTVSDVGFVVE